MFNSFFESFQPLAAIAVTPKGANTMLRLMEQQVPLWVPESIVATLPDTLPTTTDDRPLLHPYMGPLRDQLPQLWATHRGLIFCLATGAVIRLIAPLLTDKATDPAIVVIDEAAKGVISLCGGHQGGADHLTQALASYLKAMPVITGSSHYRQQPGVDIWGKPFGWERLYGNWTMISAAIARGEPVQVIQEAGSTLWQGTIASAASHAEPDDQGTVAAESFELITFPKPRTATRLTQSDRHQVWISARQRSFAILRANPLARRIVVQWCPRVLWVGIGCERGVPQEMINWSLERVLQKYKLEKSAIAGVATIDLKADEAGIVGLCNRHAWPRKTFSAEQLRKVPVPNPSEIVAAAVGTPSVAEAAALLAAEQVGEGLAPAPPHLIVPKQIMEEPVIGEGRVTVAIAQASVEYTGRSGWLFLIGTGPGRVAQMTPEAQTALAISDVVIGYSLYIDLIHSRLRAGQLIERFPITQERQRVERAIALAKWGLTVALVSSGDAGVYGMAGLALEELSRQGWDGQTPNLYVFPGITAMQAAAARVGAPLMHDFCAISLSDLLTPWEVIEKRLQSAAQADFVTALYNPRSQTRTQQIQQAQAIFLTHRSPDTPVAIVRAVSREDEQITLTTLDQMLEATIDMLTLVIIGNQSTRRYGDWLITPRGYLGFDQASKVEG